MNPDDDDPELEALIDAHVERAMLAARVLPPELQDDLRATLRLGLRHHPGARSLLEQLRRNPAVQRSGEVPTAAYRGEKRVRRGGAA